MAGVQDGAIEDISSEGFLVRSQQPFANHCAILLWSKVHAILVKAPISGVEKFEVIGLQLDAIAGCSCVQ